MLILIKIIHLSLILFILLTPFFNNPAALIIHIASVISILFHWGMNNDACFLTLLETKLRGIENNNSFIHKIVSPVYKFTELDVTNLSYFVITLLGLASIIKLYKILKNRRTKFEIYNRD